MGNNNNISAFEKVVFVDKIDNEYDAEQLSKEYPFAYIVTDKTSEGLNNGILVDSNNDIIEGIKDTNDQIVSPNHSSGNIWKGGERLTKFINVDSSKNTAQFDAYDLKLEFNQKSGLLSFLKIPKIDDYKVVSLFYKYKNDLKTYINKSIIWEDRAAGILPNSIANTYSTEVDLENFLDTYDDINTIINDNDKLTTANISNLDTTNKGFIDSIDNKVYLVLRFEAKYAQTLNAVSNTSFNIKANVENESLLISKNASLLNSEEHLKKYMNISNNDAIYSKINKIGKITYNYVYNSTQNASTGQTVPACRYFIYELEVKTNTNYEHLNNLNFSFENASNLNSLNIGIDQLFINPTSYKLFINNNEVNLENTDLITYLMPNTTNNCRLELYPNKLSDFRLSITSNRINKENLSEEQRSHFTFDNGFISPQINDGNNNVFTFNIIASNYYDYDSEIQDNEYNTSKTTLSFELHKYDSTNTSQPISSDVYWFKETYVQKYNWQGWSFGTILSGDNPFNGYLTTLEATALSPVSFHPGQINAIFNIPGSENLETQQVLDITKSTQITWYFNPGNNYIDDIDNTSYANNADYMNDDPTTVGLPSNKTLSGSGESINFIIPFIFRRSEGANFGYKYTHKSNTINGDEIHINPAEISKISINGGITFNDINNGDVVTNIESGTSVEIRKNNKVNKYLKLTYPSGATTKDINAYKYLYRTLDSFKHDIKIGLSTSTVLDENDNDKTRTDGVKYVEIDTNNSKLIYNSDDARISENTVLLQISYYDPNFETIISTSKYNDYLTLKVNKLLIDYWMYLGEVYNITKNSQHDVIGFNAVIPDIPNEATEESEPHYFDKNNSDIDPSEIYNISCGVLYKYRNPDHPEYSDRNSTVVLENDAIYEPPYDSSKNTSQVYSIENSFGTWIHLGIENNFENLNLEGASSNTIFSGTTRYKIFGGNTEYIFIIIPDILELRISDDITNWAWSNVEQPTYIFKKGGYKGYIVLNELFDLPSKSNPGVLITCGDGYSNDIVVKRNNS